MKESSLAGKRSPIQQKANASSIAGSSFSPPEYGLSFIDSRTVQKKANKTGMPDRLKSGVESLSGLDMSDVRVHYNSSQPAQLNAHAYAQGNQIHIAPGQQKHLPHEAWHVVQQKQGRVKPTRQMKGKVNINDDNGLEREADVMGQKSLSTVQLYKSPSLLLPPSIIPLSKPPIQLTERGKWWGGAIGSVVGGVAGAAAGHLLGTISTTAGIVSGGLSDAVAGYQQGGFRGALMEGASGMVARYLTGVPGAAIHGGSIGMTLGSTLGSKLGDYLSGEEAGHPNQALLHDMVVHLNTLQNAAPLVPAVGTMEKVQETVDKKGALDSDEIKLLNWLHAVLKDDGLKKVSEGAQVRVPFNPGVFEGLKNLHAERRESSHYSGLLFASGFTQVIGEQYGTVGKFLPTLLFGKIRDREGKFFIYFQPERNAHNPSTDPKEKAAHKYDAFRYAVLSRQQGPHGESRHTDGNPITNNPYTRLLSDFGYSRVIDFDAFITNFLYIKCGFKLPTGVSIDSHKARIMAMEILVKAGTHTAAFAVMNKLSEKMLDKVGYPLVEMARKHFLG